MFSSKVSFWPEKADLHNDSLLGLRNSCDYPAVIAQETLHCAISINYCTYTSRQFSSYCDLRQCGGYAIRSGLYIHLYSP